MSTHPSSHILHQKGVITIKLVKTTAVIIAAALVFVVSSCAYQDDSSEEKGSNTEGKTYSEAADDKTSLYYNWQGEELTAAYAEENGCVMLGESSERSGEIWADFKTKADNKADTHLTVCTESSVIMVSMMSSGESGYSAYVQIKEASGDRVITTGRSISPGKISCVRKDNSFEYYLSDLLIYTEPADDGDSYADIPLEFDCYSVSADAAMTFPYQKTFSSYSDFQSYYDKYNSSLGLEELKAELEEYEAEGGFNAHVVFLYGDMAASADAGYEFLRASSSGGKLSIYLRKTEPRGVSGITKWQLVCKVPGEHLVDVKPEEINWVIYSDYVTKG